jgi:hypothetical protein
MPKSLSSNKFAMKKIRFLIYCLIFYPLINFGQVIEDEAKIPAYSLPSLLVSQKGEKITNSDSWWKLRRPEIIKMLAEQEYGKVPGGNVKIAYRILNENSQVIEGLADRKEVLMEFSGNDRKIQAILLIYLPAGSKKPVPVFLGYNFTGNHAVFPDPQITITSGWMENNPQLEINNNRASEISRGSSAERYPLLNILRRGYGFATIYYGDIDPDFDDGFENGIHPLFYTGNQALPAKDEWGSISAWAWGLSRALDYLVTDPQIDPGKVIVFGHSRLGKTALWAGAQDQRFALVISNESGCGGAALSKRIFGETVGRINTTFPHWFCDNFNQFNDRENTLPFDQHMLLACIAPRPLYVASAANDLWADPKGEFLSLYYASEVYELLGAGGIKLNEMPGTDAPLISGKTGYHIRTGDHDLTIYDWERFMDFADKSLK